MSDPPSSSGRDTAPRDETLARLVSELEGLRAWTSAPKTDGPLPARLRGFLHRAFRRFRMLGKHQELESRILVETMASLELLTPALQRIASLEKEFARLERDAEILRPVPAELGSLGRRVGAVQAANDAVGKAYGEVSLRISAAEAHLGDARRKDAALDESLSALREEVGALDAAAARSAALDSLKSDLRSRFEQIDETLSRLQTNLALLEEAATGLPRLDALTSELGARLQQFGDAFAAQQARTAELEARPRLEPAVDAVTARLSDLATRLEVAAHAQAATAGSAQASARSLEEAHRMLRDHESRFRFLRQEIPALRERPLRIAVDPGLFRRILVELDEKIPGLRDARAIEVSIQDSGAESLLFEANRHFGARMSSSHPLYLAPNDAWIHVDLTADAARPVLFQNAAARLAPGGLLVLVVGRTFPDSLPASVAVTFENVKADVGASGEQQIVVFRKHAPAA